MDKVNKIKKALLLGFDGVDPITFQRLFTTHQLPNFEKFKIQKAYTGGVEGTPTEQVCDSGPGWLTILTGAYANKHHSHSNGLTWNKKVPTIFTLIKNENPEAQIHAFSGWYPLNDKIFKKHSSILQREEDNKRPLSDIEVGEKIINTLQNRNPDFIFAQFDDIDEVAHLHSHSIEQDDIIIQADKILGQILETLNNRKQKYQFEDWLVLIVTDHGRDEKGQDHGHSPQIESEKQIFIGTNQPHIMNTEFNKELHMGINANRNHLFDGIPLIGQLGLQKLIMHENILKWSYDKGSFCAKEESNNIDIYVEKQYLETIQIEQEIWPQSEIAHKAWQKGIDFTFIKNGVPVTFRNKYFTKNSKQQEQELQL